ncbi:MAG: hypothetical protein AB7O37_08045 [Vicinamibacteria bacterium]
MAARTRIAFTGLIAMVPPREGGPALALCPSTRQPIPNLPPEAPATSNARHFPLMAVTRARQLASGSAAFHSTGLVVPLEGCVVRLTEKDPRTEAPKVPPLRSWEADFKGFKLKELWRGGLVDRALLPSAAWADPRIAARVEIWLSRYVLSHADLSPADIPFTDPSKTPQRPATFVVLDHEEGIWIDVLKADSGERLRTWNISGSEPGEPAVTFSYEAWGGLEVPDELPDYQFLRFYELLDPGLKPGPADRPPVPKDPRGENDNPRCVPAGLEVGA